MEILTTRLHLREFTMDEWPILLQYQRDPRYLKYDPGEDRSGSEVREFVQKQVTRQNEKPRRSFQVAITLRKNKQFIGNCGVRKKTADSEIGDLGYELAPEYWGQGFATEAAQAMLHFGFTELKLRRIWAACFAENIGSWRVMEKVGMKREGHFFQKEWFKGRWWDTLVYAILDKDWQAHHSGSP